MSGYFCFSPLVYAGGFGVFGGFVGVLARGIVGCLIVRDWCGSGCTGSCALDGGEVPSFGVGTFGARFHGAIVGEIGLSRGDVWRALV